MNERKHIINYLSTYIVPKNFKKSKSLITLADHLFKRIDIIDEDDTKIKNLIINITPLPPFVKHSLININKISDEMVTELLNSYISDGGSREFKDILDPDSEEPISDSDDGVDNNYVYYIDDYSESE